MLPKSNQPISHQPQLFFLEESLGTVEIFPGVWTALEDFTQDDTNQRHAALDRIIEFDAPRFSPLVAYILLTRIIDQDLDLRTRIVEVLCSILELDENGQPAPEEVRSSIHLHVSGFRTRQIFSLLQVSDRSEAQEMQVAHILNSCPFAGNHLVDIIKDHKNPIEIRRQAAIMIGRVGYLSTLPALERLAGRLETRLQGQQKMYFASRNPSLEESLLPAVQEAINLLRAP
jgi:hypothetical protein